MKQKIERTNTSTKRFSTRTIALILSIVMLIGSIATGSMLSTFAAYLNDAASADAVAQAAAQGGNIALNAIPSEKTDAAVDTDKAEPKPDLSGVEENEIVRGMKDDLASTGVKTDLAKTGYAYGETLEGKDCGVRGNFRQDGSYTSTWAYSSMHYTGWNEASITYICPANKTYYFRVVVNGSDYGPTQSSWGYNSGNGWGDGTTKDYFNPTYTTDNSFYVKTNNASSGYVKITIRLWAKYDNQNKVDVTQTDMGVAPHAFGQPNGESSWGDGTSAYFSYDDATGYYYYDVENKSAVYFKVWFFDKHHYTAKSTSNNVNLTTSPLGTWHVESASSNKPFYVSASNKKIRIWVNAQGVDAEWDNTDGVKVWYEELSTTKTYYLTGWLSGQEHSTTDLAFTETSSGSGVYTYTYTCTGDQGGYQYMTITDSDGNTYHPQTHESGTGVAYHSTDTSPNANPKWKAEAASGKTITLTWDTTQTKATLSWVVSGSSRTATDLRVLYSTSASITGLQKMDGATVYQNSDGSYYVNFSDKLSSTLSKTGEYYIALSTTDDYKGMLGGAHKNNNPTGSISVKEGSEFFNTSVMQEYYGQTTGYTDNKYYYSHIKLTNSPNGLKVNVSVSGNSVVYNWYASGTAYVDTEEEEEQTVTVYAKDGAAPIDWDNKTHAGATGFDGYSGNYYYNFAAIADTTVTATGVSFTDKTCDIGNTTGYTGESTYQTGDAPLGTTLTVTTTISSDYKTKYYVRGWCVNGATYSGNNLEAVNTTKDTTGGVYTMTYTIPENITTSYLEITPIYYPIDESNTITFYLEGFDAVVNEWGTTPYAYPFYGSLSGYQNSFGTYPGQPFVYVDGKYSTEIPITSAAIYDDSEDGTLIKGVTVSNGYADHVHRNLVYTSWQELGANGNGDDIHHMQTYDYDNFYKIYNEKRDSQGNKVTSIILRMKNKTVTNNRDTYGSDSSSGHNWNYGSPVTPNDTLSSTTVDSIATSGNGWELLTDRYNRPVDLFGNVIGNTYSETAEASKSAIRVISSGYNENIAGDYGTSWIVYTPNSNTSTKNATSGQYTSSSYTLQKDTTTDRYAIPPSIFLLSGSSSFNTKTYPDASHGVDGYNYTDSVNNYKTLYTNLNTSGDSGVNAIGRYVYVSYEKNAQRKGNNYGTGDGKTTSDYGAFRSDARWYYTYATDMVNSKVKIQYWDSTNNTWVDDAFSQSVVGYGNKHNVGTHTGCKAYFTNSAFEGETASGDVLIDSGNFNFTATSASGWMFDSWQIEYDDGDNYTKLSSNATASTSMSTSDTYVARFVPITSGNLNISHNVETNTTYKGTGTAALQVKVYTSADTASRIELYDSGVVYDDVALDGTYISNAHAGYYIDVTLTTTSSADDKVAGIVYDAFNTAKSITPETTGTLDQKGTYTSHFGFTVGDLYTNNEQTTLSLAYLSHLTAVDHAYNITYNYASRGSSSNDKSFTAKGTFTSTEYGEACTNPSAAVGSRTVTNAFIKSKAPFESNFMKTMTLNYSGATQSCSTVSDVITHNVTISFTTNDSKSMYVIFDLPYDYYKTSDTKPEGSKSYTAKLDENDNKVIKNDNTVTFEIDTNYLEYFTSTGNQNKVEKDTLTENHINNDFITAPNTIYDADSEKYLYFNYWQIYKTDRTTEVARVYYTDFNYLAYGNYYVKPVYVEQDQLVKYTDSGLSASVVYLGDSRNQWNDFSKGLSTSQNVAADLIYNDFAFAFGSDNNLVSTMDNAEIGVIIERVTDSDAGASAAISNMDAYKTMYSSTESASKTAVSNYLKNGTKPSFTAIKQVLPQNDLNNKNRMEKYFSFYSKYGQNDDLTFKTDSAVDNFVYRAWAYIKVGSDVEVSDPAYFCMKYTANIASYTGS